ncbi:MAG: SDR family NAD(P)-dependent oxidoreductase, partial [Candidatus Nanopelagicales bacterium]
MTSDLHGRHALVTGAAGGIGEACARRLASLGARVTVADVDGDGAARVADELGGRAWVVDLADTESLEDVELDDVDILVNNAGVQRIHPVHEFPPDEWRWMQRLMVESPFLLARAVLPGMHERGWGRIV